MIVDVAHLADERRHHDELDQFSDLSKPDPISSEVEDRSSVGNEKATVFLKEA